MIIHEYDVTNYDFISYFENLFECNDLHKLHEKDTLRQKFDMLNNSNTCWHDKFYKDIKNNNTFIGLYERFLNEHIATLFDEKFIFQKTPTLRVHLVDNWATPEFHVDTQDGYNHPPGENNFILPLTRCYGSNTVWVETEPNKGDYTPVVVEPGQVFQFSGGTLRHGNKINNTNETRISFDFRVMPLSKYDSKYPKTSATKKIKFIIGDYYRELE